MSHISRAPNLSRRGGVHPTTGVSGQKEDMENGDEEKSALAFVAIIMVGTREFVTGKG